MAQSKAKAEYDREYKRRNMVTISARLSREADAELIAIWNAIENKAEFIREALRTKKSAKNSA